MLSISKEQVLLLPEVKYPGKVILVDTPSKAKSALSYLRKMKQIGFDTETRPSFQKFRRYNVSLMQLSAGEECFLFRLKEIGSLQPLMDLLEDEKIQKIGLSIKDDFHSLAKLAEFTPRGFVELQTFVKDYQIADNSLQKIYGIIFGQRISKNQRLTNWEAPSLTPSQQQYAAIDAWACQKIYNHLVSNKFNPDDSPYTIDDETARSIANNAKEPSLNCCHHLITPTEQSEPANDNGDTSEKPKKKNGKKKVAESKAANNDDRAERKEPAETVPELDSPVKSMPSISLRQIIHNIFRW